MTTTGTYTSSLRSAREWRGVSLAVAARTCGLPMMQAEALENGQLDAFSSPDEMIAAAVLYGASLGIGRDEATALLDRTIAANGVATAETADENDTPAGNASFSMAVRDRSTAIQQRDDAGILTLEPLSVDTPSVGESGVFPGIAAGQTGEIPVIPNALVQPLYGSSENTGELPSLPREAFEAANRAPQLSDNPTIQAAMQLDPGWRRALEQSQSELEAWAATGPKAPHPIARKAMELTERVLGPQRAERISTTVNRGAAATRQQIGTVRTRMERSEHGTLIVALGVGVMLIAIMIALASVLDSGKTSDTTIGATKPTNPKPAATAPATTDPKSQPAKPKPILKPSQIQLDILNSGHKSGLANDVAAQLKSKGYTIKSVGNSDSKYQTAIIMYPQGLRREALRLSRQSNITTTDILPNSKGQTKMLVILV